MGGFLFAFLVVLSFSLPSFLPFSFPSILSSFHTSNRPVSIIKDVHTDPCSIYDPYGLQIVLSGGSRAVCMIYMVCITYMIYTIYMIYIVICPMGELDDLDCDMSHA